MSEPLLPPFKVRYKESVLIFEISFLITSLIAKADRNISFVLFLIFLTTLCLTISTYISSRKYRLVLKFTAAVIFLHLTLIPMLCVQLLKNDNNSFRFESEVVKNE